MALSYEDVAYALDAAGDDTFSKPSDASTPIVVLAEIDGQPRELHITAVECQADRPDWKLSVVLRCE
jgi:hypothetical protein